MTNNCPPDLLQDESLRATIHAFLSTQPQRTSSFSSLHAKFFKKHSFATMKAYFKSQQDQYLVKSQSVILTQGAGHEAQGPSTKTQGQHAASTQHQPHGGSQDTTAVQGGYKADQGANPLPQKKRPAPSLGQFLTEQGATSNADRFLEVLAVENENFHKIYEEAFSRKPPTATRIASKAPGDSLAHQLGEQLTLGADIQQGKQQRDHGDADSCAAAAAAAAAASAHNRGSPLASLPPDCLAHIFSKCDDDDDMQSFSSCCKALRCKAVRSQFKRIFVNVTAIPHAVQGLSRFASLAPGLEELQLSLETEDQGPPSIFAMQGPMKGAWQIIKLFQACQEFSPAGAAARQSLSRVQCLTLLECNLKGTTRGNLRHLCEHLKTLCPKLTRVQLMGVDFDDACLAELIQPLQLTALELSPSGNFSISPLGLAQLTTLTDLSLDLAQDEDGRLKDLSLLSRLPLQRLQLEGPVDEDPRGLDKILQQCGQLKHLHLYGMPKYMLPKSASLECLVIEDLATDDLPKLVAAVQRNLSPVYEIESLTVYPDTFDGTMKDVKSAASKLARYKAVKWDRCDNLTLDQMGGGASESDEGSDLMDYYEEEDGMYGDDDDDDGKTEKHAAFKDTLNALEPLGRVLQGTVTALGTIGVHFRKRDMKQLARFAGTAVQDLNVWDCVLARTTLAEAVRALPALTHMSVGNLGLAKNHRAVLEGIEAHVDSDRQQPLHVELRPRDIWDHPSGDDYGCQTHMKMDKERDHMDDIAAEGDLHGGKVVVTVDDSDML